MGCIEALDVPSQALWSPDFLALSFLLATTVIKSVIPLVASHFIDQYLSNLNQFSCDRFAGLLWPLYPTNSGPVCR